MVMRRVEGIEMQPGDSFQEWLLGQMQKKGTQEKIRMTYVYGLRSREVPGTETGNRCWGAGLEEQTWELGLQHICNTVNIFFTFCKMIRITEPREFRVLIN